MEIEIRAKIDNIADLENNLIRLGAKFIKRKKQIDKYFGEIALFEKIGYSFMMRVRDEGDKKYLTYKGARTKKDGVWEEYEFPISDEKAAEEMLMAMGLERIIEVKKNRSEYGLDGMSICLDEIDGLGNYIEIESLDDDDIGKTKLEKIMNLTGIGDDQIVHKGYITMLLAKNNSPYSEFIKN
jgi:adenylate cyclase, class 2